MKRDIKKVKKTIKKTLRGKNFMKFVIAFCTVAIIATSILPYIL